MPPLPVNEIVTVPTITGERRRPTGGLNLTESQSGRDSAREEAALSQTQIAIDPPVPINPAPEATAVSSRNRKRRKKNAKLPPLALQENAGHLIFVGNKVIGEAGSREEPRSHI